ncbi:MAG TPA: VOC family protein [Gemmatimonadaceae bacterium]|nr:VOC family protein [Gemmatimonadaceae bacterium]
MGQPVVQFQILARDPDTLTAFYAKLFGWRVDADNPMGYRMVDTGSDRGISGGVWPIGPTDGHPLVQLFVEVDDVAASVMKVEQLGGRIVIPPQTLPDGDRLAIVLDTEGLSLGVMQRRASTQSTEKAVS